MALHPTHAKENTKPKAPPPTPPPRHRASVHEDKPEFMAPEHQAKVDERAASPVTVTVRNPTPPTNIACVTTGSPPVSPADAALFAGAGVPGSTTTLAAPTGGSGPAPEATGTVVVDTKPGATSITVMGAYTNTPNASHPSSQAPPVLPVITSLSPASTPGDGATVALVVNGTGFEEASVIHIGGVTEVTTFVSTTRLEALNAVAGTAPGTIPVTVVTGGTASAPVNWTFT
jgi:hypothetical protein